MTKESSLDLDSEGRLDQGDGYQYKVHLLGGQVSFLRDHDSLASLTARLEQAVAEKPAAIFHFSGAKGREERPREEGEGVEDVEGPLRGKGWHRADQIVGITYSEGEPPPATQEAAYAAAIAYVDAQRSALETRLLEIPASAGAPGGEGGGDVDPDAKG